MMGEHHSFGEAGGSGGVLHVDHVVAAYISADGLNLEVVDMAPHEQEFLGVIHTPVFLLADENHIPQCRKTAAVQFSAGKLLQLGNQLENHLQVIALPVTIDHAQGMDIGILQDIFEFRFLVAGIDGDQNGSDFGGGKHKGEPVGDVLGPYAHLVAGLNADVKEAFGQPVDAVVETPVREAEVAVRINDEFLVRGFNGPFLENFAQGVIQ